VDCQRLKPDGFRLGILYTGMLWPDGTLWLGGNGKIFSYDGQTWQVYGPDEGVPDGIVGGLAFHPETGGVWAASQGGLLRFDGVRFEQVPVGSIEDEGVSDVGFDGEILWVTTDHHVARFDGNDWTVFGPEAGLTLGRFHALAIEPAGSVWFATSYGLYWTDGQRFWYYPPEAGLPNRSIEDVTVTQDGRLWVIGYASGAAWTELTGNLHLP